MLHESSEKIKNIDYIIVGQGIAGSLLAWELFSQGLRVKIIDDGHRSSASTVAAGILNPITGQRLVKSWELEKFLPVAKVSYQKLETSLNAKFFYEREILRLFKNDYEMQQYQKRKIEEGYEDYIGDHFEPETFGDVFQDAHGSFIIKEAANLDTKVFLSALRDFFKKNDILDEQVFSYEDIIFDESTVSYKGIQAKKIIFCEGYKVIENPWFKDLHWELAKGEILTLKLKTPLPDKIINCGKWLMPTADGLCKVGASYNWENFDNQPTDSGRADIIDSLRNNILTDDDPIKIVAQEAGVRPCTKNSKPYIGLHSGNNYLGIFNGFGSKGTLMAPYYAKQFVNFLETGAALDEEVSLNRG